jgi:hypothetical protein
VVALKENGHILFKLGGGQATDLQANKTVAFSYAEGKITIDVNQESQLVLPN